MQRNASTNVAGSLAQPPSWANPHARGQKRQLQAQQVGSGKRCGRPTMMRSWCLARCSRCGIWCANSGAMRTGEIATNWPQTQILMVSGLPVLCHIAPASTSFTITRRPRISSLSCSQTSRAPACASRCSRSTSTSLWNMVRATTMIPWQRLTRSLVVKNPLSPAEHPGGLGVNNELFEQSLEQFVVRTSLLLCARPLC